MLHNVGCWQQFGIVFSDKWIFHSRHSLCGIVLSEILLYYFTIRVYFIIRHLTKNILGIKNLKLFFLKYKEIFLCNFHINLITFSNIVHDKIVIMISVHRVVNIFILLYSRLLSSLIYRQNFVETKLKCFFLILFFRSTYYYVCNKVEISTL